MALEPQAALEAAVLATIRSIPGEYRYDADNSGRMFDGEPKPVCGKVWVSVWSDLARRSNSDTCLDEVYGVVVTITLRASQTPWDAWLGLRDELEARANRIRAAVHLDCLYNRIQRQASALMAADGAGQKVGFRERLKFEGLDGLQRVGPDWFKAELDHVTAADAGLALRLRFGGMRLIQTLATME